MENLSGIKPLLDRVLVRPDEIEEKTESGIVIPDKVKEHHQMAQATGTLVAMGQDAFVTSRVEVLNADNSIREIRIERWTGTPKVGDRVMFAKYGGLTTQGIDGVEYRLLNDRDITAGAEHNVKYTGIESRKRVGS